MKFGHQQRTTINTVPQRARVSVEKKALQSQNQNKSKLCSKSATTKVTIQVDTSEVHTFKAFFFRREFIN